MRIVLSYQSGVPIYEQIKEQIKALILTGQLAEGEPLPSMRQLARDLKVSVITTTRAYGDLELEGFVHTLPKKGVYVKKVNGDAVREQYRKEAEAAMLTAIQRGKTAGMCLEDLHTLLETLGENTDEKCD